MTEFTETLTDSDGDEFSLVYHGQSSQDPAPRVYVEIRSEGEFVAAGPFTPEALHAALDEVAPASADTRTRSLRNDRHYWQARAEKAEKERDKARGALRTHLEERAPTRTLTADDIESVLHDILPLSTEHLGADDIADIASDLYLALTAPARDPRAEEMQADLATAEEPEMDDEDRRLIADHLAALGYRKTGVES